ncbi:MAG TPA: TIGR00341 family protein [Pyrinomonadaceae bacterium]|nr:TIGR00341 family protein [Pyrinomonadaceae bacterium]
MRFGVKIRRLMRLLVSIEKNSDANGTIDDISKNVALRGANIWMLICSAILACIGLDLNSTAVIIGAMLISPLMSPILGVGLSIAIFDKILLKNAAKNLLLAIFLALLTSFIYFKVSPFGELTPELSARTTPTIFDVCVAFFGGVAGIVAGSRKEKTNAVPGVAIATALMPPLCTAGFGLATMRWNVFLGAFYLFFINAFFISLATYLISILLKFPKKTQPDAEENTTYKRIIIAFAILVTIPSAIILYSVLDKLRFDKNVKDFVNKEIRRDERQPIQWDISNSANRKTLKVYTVGKATNGEESARLNEELKNYGLGNLSLKLIQLNVSPDEFSRLSSNVETNIAEKIDLIESVEEENKKSVEELQKQIEELKENTDPEKVFLKDILRLFPSVESAEWSKTATENAENSSNRVKILTLKFKNETSETLKKQVNEKISRLARIRFSEESVRLIEEKKEIENEENAQRTS